MSQSNSNNQSPLLRNKYYSIFGLIFLVSLSIQVVSLLRTSILASQFGISNEMDSFYLANTMTFSIVNMLGTSIVSILIPYLTKMDDEYESTVVLNGYVTCVLGVVLGIFVLYFGVGSIYFFKIDHSIEGYSFQKMTFNLTILLGIGNFVRMMSSIQNAILQIENKFLTTKLITLLSTIVTLIYFFIAKKISITDVAMIITVSYIMEYLILIALKKKKKYHYFFVFNFQDPELKILIRRTIPIVMNALIYQLTILIPNFLARLFGEGYISMMVYSNQILSIIQALIFANLLALMYPNLSRSFQKNLELGKLKLVNCINISNLIIIPTVVGCILLGPLLIKILFERGNFTEESTYFVWKFLVFSGLSLPFVMIREFIFRAFYSIEDTKTPVKISCILFLIQILLLIMGYHFVGINAVMVSPLVSAVCMSTAAFLSLSKKIGKIDYSNQLVKQHFFILINSICMSIVVIIVQKNSHINDVLDFIVCMLIGVVSYALGVLILQRKYIKFVMAKEGN